MQLNDLEVKLAESDAELRGAFRVRHQVFVCEQKIPIEDEVDGADEAAIHVVASFEGEIVGAGRLVLMENGLAKVGRMAVAKPFRRRGIGGRMLRLLEGEARSRGANICALHAQEYVKSFYAARGYCPHGEPFLEVDIPHVEMRKRIATE